ncbi:GT2 family glycosyltransferase [Paenarthrobacter nicotinovorans]|uniref:GT2 family glycosyltransferase n=1 Tax=Paenarthrobacter nicotinovorans TaxID=29320 RepID=A0ABT9TJF8_PAENI|nr:glycosyltransferase family 2 protein [Paenarthrobacter nicotinovorans]MDQ0100647.1 GT2 family glycosyltransferase [Paenarthrobacter nicotinovorans]
MNKLFRIAVIMAVHNRREMTLACIRQVTESSIEVSPSDIYVVDDGCTDGTSTAIASEFPEVTLLQGDGSLYWGQAMAMAEREALEGEPDFILWVNDDIVLETDAIGRLIAASSAENPRAIAVGALKDPINGMTTYSGYTRRESKLGFLRLNRIDPTNEIQRDLDAFNGNLVLVPAEHYSRLKGIDDRFTHHYGDFDFGLRAKLLGIPSVLVAGHVGQTSRNSDAGTFRDSQLNRTKRYKNLFGPKGFPLADRQAFYRRHGGIFWPVQSLGFYGYWLGRIVVGI